MQPHARFRDKLYDFTRHVKNVMFASHQETVTAQVRILPISWSESFISVRPPRAGVFHLRLSSRHHHPSSPVHVYQGQIKST